MCEWNVFFVFIILLGWGEGREDEFNVIYKFDCVVIKILRNIYLYRWRILKVYGEWVGLLKNIDMGNGEVGNNVMGCGKIVV